MVAGKSSCFHLTSGTGQITAGNARQSVSHGNGINLILDSFHLYPTIELTLNPETYASQGAGLSVCVLAEVLTRTGFLGAAAPMPPLGCLSAFALIRMLSRRLSVIRVSFASRSRV